VESLKSPAIVRVNHCSGNGVYISPIGVLQQTRLVSKGLRELFFCDTVTDHVGFQAPLTAALFLLPVYHGECEIQCHEKVKPTF